MQAIALHDLVEMTPATETSLTCSGMDVNSAQENTVLKAHAALERAAKKPLPTRFHLHKRIPPGSGMGGASSDAATTLLGLRALYQLREVDLATVAIEIGADVAFFLRGGRVRAEGRGERLTPIHFTEEEWFAIAWPGIELSTAAVYRAWDEVQGDGPNELKRAAEHVDPRVKEFARSLGDGWRMTGSGSAFFKRCANEDEARKAAAGLDGWTTVSPSVGAW